MKTLPLQRRTLTLIAVLLPMLALFVYVALRSGPLAPISVVVASVEDRAVAPALFGIGTVDARYTYKIGPTFAGRIRRVDVNVGDHVQAGQVLGEMDPVDLDDRIRGQEAALLSAQAQLREAQARQAYARSQARRYEELGVGRYVSQEMVAGKRQELQVADAGLGAATQQVSRAQADREALASQRSNLLLVAEVDGIVAVRNADPGTTVVAGQSVVELIDPDTLWINTRFDQVSAHGLKPGLPVRIVLRSRAGIDLPGRVLLVEPMADAVTEEVVAKIAFDRLPVPMPSIGELAEVTVSLPALAARPVVPNASVQRVDGTLGVWTVRDGDLELVPVKLGATDLDGNIQVLEGVRRGDRVVTYSERTLTTKSRIHVVDQLKQAR
ncbi:efflux RND transporter periplasmic adaptor subunit [Thermomonas mangrovi]|jgi:RND family efflux transporter MFP subunit|uniref:efflux RND transporter periplasmic adaptor subunit n=1 Tax=Thermomonas mangrovi TaxID=2993316 RepID=UPI002306F99A|nr:efflux RND transporter periplasmic adaptor subunit [Thermomonas mangrovi]